MKSNKNNGYILIISSSILLRKRNIWEKLQRKLKQTLYVRWFFFNSCSSWDSVEKYCRAEQATGDNVAISTEWWIHKAKNRTLGICYIFSTGTMVAWRRLNITLYVQYILCLVITQVLEYFCLYISIWPTLCVIVEFRFKKMIQTN